jgi:hypothetical protein
MAFALPPPSNVSCININLPRNTRAPVEKRKNGALVRGSAIPSAQLDRSGCANTRRRKEAAEDLGGWVGGGGRKEATVGEGWRRTSCKPRLVQLSRVVIVRVDDKASAVSRRLAGGWIRVVPVASVTTSRSAAGGRRLSC